MTPRPPRPRRRPGSGGVRSPSSAVPGRCRGVARRSSQPSDQALTAMATAAVATASTGSNSGSSTAASRANRPSAPKATRPATSERRASSPMPADRTSAPITTATLSTALSFVPNRSTTKCFAPGGCSEISSAPIDSTGDGAPGTRPAISSATRGPGRPPARRTGRPLGVTVCAGIGRRDGHVPAEVSLVVGASPRTCRTSR